jgi:hypothetical protein
MRGTAGARDTLWCNFVVIPYVEKKYMSVFWRRCWLIQFEFFDRWTDQFHVIPVGAVHYDGDRDAVRLGQHAAFHAALPRPAGLGPICFSLTGSFVIAPSIASQVRSVPSLVLTAKRPERQIPRRPRHCTTPGIVDARNCWSRCRSHLLNSIDVPYALQAVSHPSQRDQSFSVSDHHADAAYVAAAMAPTGPKSDLASASYRVSSTSPR